MERDPWTTIAKPEKGTVSCYVREPGLERDSFFKLAYNTKRTSGI